MTVSAGRKRRSKLPGLVRRVVKEAGVRLAADAAGHRETRSGEALHRLRVTLRRTSAVAALFHGCPAKGDGVRAEELAHDARRALSPAREREVSASLVNRLSGEETEPSRAALTALGLDGDAPAPDVDATVSLLLESLRAWSASLASWRPAPADEERLQAKLLKRLKRARRRVRELGVPGRRRLHELRVAAKALRYELELVSGISPDAAALVAASKKFQDALGDANDWAALHRTLRDRRGESHGDGRGALDRLAPVVKEERARALDRAQREARRFQERLAQAPLTLAPAS